MSQRIRFWTGLVLGMFALSASAQTVIFEDDFSSDSSASYTHFSYPAPENTLIDFQYAYQDILNGYGETIPVSPNTQDSDLTALLVSCNILDTPDNVNSFVGVYIDQVFAGDYQVVFDFYCNVMDSGTGTTNRISAGINHSGEKMVNTYNSGYDAKGGYTTEDLQNTDGYMFGMSFDEGDGGTFKDYQFTEGTPGIDDNQLGVTPGNEAEEIPAVLPDYAPKWFSNEIREDLSEISVVGWQGGDHRSDTVLDEYVSPTAVTGELFNVLFSNEFGNPPALFAGAPGLAWHTMRIDYIDGIVTVWIKSSTIDEFAFEDFDWIVHDDDGFVKIVEYDDPDDTYTSGKVYLGMEDVWSSAWGAPSNPDAPRLQFVLYDNIQIIQIGEPPVDVDHWALY